MDIVIAPEIWNEILQYASKYPKYKGISKSILKYYKPKVDIDYIYKTYKGFDIKDNNDLYIYRYQLNRACLNKDYYVVKYMASKVFENTKNVIYIHYAIEHLHIFGEFKLIEYIIREYFKYGLFIHNTYSKNTSIYHYVKYNLLLCKYCLSIPEYQSIAKNWLLAMKTSNDIVHHMRNMQKDMNYIGYIDSNIYNIITGYNDTDVIINKFVVSLDTNLDYITYIIKTRKLPQHQNILTSFNNENLLKLLVSVPVCTPLVLNYIAKELLPIRMGLGLKNINSLGSQDELPTLNLNSYPIINPVAVRILRDRIKFINIDKSDRIYRIALDMQV